MYVCTYINIVLILCMIKIRLGGVPIVSGECSNLEYSVPPPLCFDFENYKNTRNELASPVKRNIFLVIMCVS